ncbi:hypothetical protein YYG_04709 [Plasmodium vinckei petteri]|uniref:Para-hydroxybenzoate--polyprenyltransferase, putative n=1 Tax=Plasmodium vinckei petteri TaxID=138298 RepID=W7AXF0_PLAVN|nr:hypothetical protein YYG_04709 [Plasmodium vinckei petteri]CAD2095216.1 para-hydroxybenzoate--polyprenyltransferase, putative [Plasmodium vinckei petteri]
MKRYINLSNYKYVNKQRKGYKQNEKQSNFYMPNCFFASYKNGVKNSQTISENNFKQIKIFPKFEKTKNKLTYPLQFELSEQNENSQKCSKHDLKKIENIGNNGSKPSVGNVLTTKINEINLKSLHLGKFHYSSSLNVHNEDKRNDKNIKIKERIKKNINSYIIFSRMHIPTGTYLTLYSSLWGYLLTYDVSKLFLVNNEIYTNEININEIQNIIKNLSLFIFGAYNSRTFGCMINDFLDKKYDKHVERTKNRPLADGSISTPQALVYMFIHSSLSLITLFQFSNETIYTGLFTSFFIMTYPLLKRITYYAQVYLSFTFNLGFFITSSVNINILENIGPLIISFIPLCYLTIIYDTIYAHQDKADDIKLKLKSLAIKWDKNTIKYSKILIINMIYLLYMSAYLFNIHYSYYAFTTFNVAYLYYLINGVSLDDKEKCMNFFKKSKSILFLFFLASLTAKVFEALEKRNDKGGSTEMENKNTDRTLLL